MASATDETATNRTLRESIAQFGWRRIAYSLVVLVFFGLLALFGLWRDLLVPFVGWFDAGLDLFAEDFEAVPPHRGHLFVFALLLWTAAAGLLAGVWNPRSNVAGQWMALLPWAGLLLGLVLADFLAPLPIVGIFGGVTLVATLLHPAGRGLVASFGRSRVSTALLALVLVAAVPLLVYSATQVGLQSGSIEPAHGHDHGGSDVDHEAIHQEHVDAGHFAGSAAFGFVVVGLGLLSSLRPDGWWLPAWLAGVATAVFGVASILYPEAASTADPIWGLAAVLWGVAFVVVAERGNDAETQTPLGRWRESATGEATE